MDFATKSLAFPSGNGSRPDWPLQIILYNNQSLENVFVERPDHQRTVGNIYKGKVQNVIPGMQAAFIDIGFHINAFLPFAEISDLSKLNDISFSIDENGKGKSNKKKPGHTRPAPAGLP